MSDADNEKKFFLSSVFIFIRMMSGAGLLAAGYFLSGSGIQYLIMCYIFYALGGFLLLTGIRFLFLISTPWLILNKEGVKSYDSELISWKEMRSIEINYDQWDQFVSTISRYGPNPKRFYLYIDLKDIEPDYNDSNLIKIELNKLDVELIDLQHTIESIAPEGSHLKFTLE